MSKNGVCKKKFKKYFINLTFKATVSEFASAFPKRTRTLIHESQINGVFRFKKLILSRYEVFGTGTDEFTVS
jgi:hypothetical protein